MTGLLTTSAASVLAADAPKRPNVVFILADDLGWGEVGCYGQTKIPTPNIDRLAAEGMRFTQHYSGSPVCAPSRCVLMTGKHGGHAEIRDNQPARLTHPEFDEGQFPLSEDAITLAQVFQQAGYATGAMGKWGLGPVGSSGDPNRKGFDLFFGYNCQRVAHSYFPPHLWRNSEKVLLNTTPVPGHKKQPNGPVRLEDWQGEHYAPELMIAEAENFIADHRHQPFFLYLPFIEPHVAMHPRPDSVNRFPEKWDSEPYRGENGYLPHPRPRAGYAAMISDLDSHVGRVLDALQQAGVLDKTLIVFTSDNGTTLPRKGKGTNPHFHVGGVDAKFFESTRNLNGYKGSVYEGGIRVPMIVRFPGHVPAGTVNDTPSYFPDWFPTLCEAVGIEAPPGLDGESLWPAMTSGKTINRKSPMVWVFRGYGGQVAVRVGEFKVLRQQLNTKQPGPWEVYNIAADPGEQHDLANSHPEIIQQAKMILNQQVTPNETFPVNIPE